MLEPGSRCSLPPAFTLLPPCALIRGCGCSLCPGMLSWQWDAAREMWFIPNESTVWPVLLQTQDLLVPLLSSSEWFSASVCKLCGYPKKNIRWGKKRYKLKMSGTKLYQKSWAHISFDDFSVCVQFLALQLLGFFLLVKYTQKGLFLLSVL